MKQLTILITIAFILTACTWVDLSPEGEKVRVLSASEVTSCKKLGKTIVSLKDKIAGFDRSEEKVQKELEALARNSAVDLKGDTVVSASEIKDGKQTFDVYRCVNP